MNLEKAKKQLEDAFYNEFPELFGKELPLTIKTIIRLSADRIAAGHTFKWEHTKNGSKSLRIL